METKGYKFLKKLFLLFLLGFSQVIYAQMVPMGVKYQAVARNNQGEELQNASIDVRMSVIAGNPDGVVEWKEIHTNIQTSRFGLFSVVIGKGDRTGGIATDFTEIPWGESNHYLKVEIKFDQEFLEMGTSQFLSVPYALYAQNSLTPGPEGPPGPPGEKGDPGDPATDDQNIHLNDHELSIDNGNTVTLPDNVNDPDPDPANEIQDLRLEGNLLYLTINDQPTMIDLSKYLDNSDDQQLSIDGNILSIENGNAITLPDEVNDPDADPANEIQILSLVDNTLSIKTASGDITNSVSLTDFVEDDDADPNNEIQDLIRINDTLWITGNTDANPIDLQRYYDNTDNQILSFHNDTLYLSGGGRIFLGDYLDNTDNQQISYTPSTSTLTLEKGGVADLSDLANIPLIGFRSTSVTPEDVGTDATSLINFPEVFDHSDCYNNGVFTAPADGVYSFYVSYDYHIQQTLLIYLNGNPYEFFYGSGTTNTTQFISFSFLYELSSGQTVSLYLITKLDGQCGAGTFSGFRVH